MPLELFRYSKRRHNDSLLTNGDIRIGTLHDFRSSEHKKGIKDTSEGRKVVSHTIDDVVFGADGLRPSGSAVDERAFEHFSILKGFTGKHSGFQNVTVSENVENSDCFILCMSSRLSKETMAQFEGADSCVQIVLPMHFFRCVTKELNRHCQAKFLGTFEVNYRDRDEEWNGHNWGSHPALVKSPEFQKQFEIRAIWQPTGLGNIDPLILRGTRCNQYCRERVIQS